MALLPFNQTETANLQDAQNIEIQILESFKGDKMAPTKWKRPARLALNNDGTVGLIDSNGSIVSTASETSIFDLINSILQTSSRFNKSAWQTDDGKVRFVREYIDDQSELPCISFAVNMREPGQWAKGRMGSAGTNILKPTLVDSFPHPNIANTEVHIMSQLYDSEIELTVHSKTAHEADQMLSWVEDAININLWFFKHAGIMNFHFKKRDKDENVQINDTVIYRRTLRYFVQYEKISWYNSQILKSLILQLQLR